VTYYQKRESFVRDTIKLPFSAPTTDDGFPAAWQKVWSHLLLSVRLTCWAVIIFTAVSRSSAVFVWDDSYMFYRYADNLVRYGVLDWNPHEAPTYGLTSPLFLMLVLPFRFLFPSEPALVLYLSSVTGGLLFLALMLRLVRHFLEGGPLARSLAETVIMISAAISARPLSAHFASGMDTTFAMAFLTAYLLLIKINEKTRTSFSAVCMGLWGGLAIAARPDLMLYTLLVPASIFLTSKDPEVQRNARLSLCLTFFLASSWVALAYTYFGSPLPLSFYAKTLGAYDDTIYRELSSVPIRELGGYMVFYGVLVLIIVANISLNYRSWWNRTSVVDKSLILSTVLFILYYTFFVLQIMPYHARFYYPTFPAIAYLAARSIIEISGTISNSLRPRFVVALWQYRCHLTLGLLVPILVGCVAFGYGVWKKGPAYVRIVSKAHFDFDVFEDYSKRWRHNWFELDKFSALPDDLMIATTEVGMVAAMNRNKAIIDLAGLNETSIAHNGFSGASFFERYQPDLLYMPLPVYTRIISQIVGHPYFKKTYEYFPSHELGTDLGVALKKTSPHYQEMRAIVLSKTKGRERGVRDYEEGATYLGLSRVLRKMRSGPAHHRGMIVRRRSLHQHPS
jgi:hypothetical protein